MKRLEWEKRVWKELFIEVLVAGKTEGTRVKQLRWICVEIWDKYEWIKYKVSFFLYVELSHCSGWQGVEVMLGRWICGKMWSMCQWKIEGKSYDVWNPVPVLWLWRCESDMLGSWICGKMWSMCKWKINNKNCCVCRKMLNMSKWKINIRNYYILNSVSLLWSWRWCDGRWRYVEIKKLINEIKFVKIRICKASPCCCDCERWKWYNRQMKLWVVRKKRKINYIWKPTRVIVNVARRDGWKCMLQHFHIINYYRIKNTSS